jgi:cytochrome-b5 reductase
LLTRLGVAIGLAAVTWVFYRAHLDRSTVLRSLLFAQPLVLVKSSGHFWWGIGITSIVEVLASVGLTVKVWEKEKLNIHHEFGKYLERITHLHRLLPPPKNAVVTSSMSQTATSSGQRGPNLPLDPKIWRPFKLVRRTLVSTKVFKLVFALPHAEDILGLPTGQHIALRAVIDGKAVSRSYTPVSNNQDLGRVELLVKVYDHGLLTKHLEAMQIGDTIDIRGPKGAMEYSRHYAKHIGMIAGGTGITPMFQLIRAICADEDDTTKISLLYASRTEEDILLRDELENYALHYPHKFQLSYVLSSPPEGWKGRVGHIDQALIREQLPSAGGDTKMLLCGPPLMVEAMTEHLTSQGFKEPGLMSKSADQVFVF